MYDILLKEEKKITLTINPEMAAKWTDGIINWLLPKEKAA